MNVFSPVSNASAARRFPTIFRSRDFFVHDGRALRRLRLSGAAQGAMALIAFALLAWSAFAAVAFIAAARGEDRQLASVEANIRAVRAEVKDRAHRIEAQQRFLAEVMAGDTDGETLKALLAKVEGDAGDPLAAAEARQRAFVEAARALTEARYAQTAAAIRDLGLSPVRLQRIGAGMGGPYEPVAADAETDGDDAAFRQLFQSWARLDQLERGVMSVPSQKPVDNLVFTSLYGIRSDPFRGSRAMHAGVDIPGPVGTPIYATADGIVRRAGWANGYGNLIEIGHGRGIDTRYGHLSQISVQANTRVKRGDLIGRMGSTGRSTGSHLHYEVRIDGRAVDPTPFLRASDFVLAVQDRMASGTGQGGPESQLADD